MTSMCGNILCSAKKGSAYSISFSTVKQKRFEILQILSSFIEEFNKSNNYLVFGPE
jgi:hypothetical protein